MSLFNLDPFFEDPQLLEAQKKLIEILKKHQSNLNGPKPPDPQKQIAYKELIENFSTTRAGKLFFPYISSGIGNGPFVKLMDGSVKYDFISGIGVHHFGHSHPKIIAAAIKGALYDTPLQGNLQQTIHTYHFSEKLLKAANTQNAKLKHCFLTTSGAMAGENALKLAFQKKYPANRLLAFKGCFAGRTTTFSQITDKAAYRNGIPLNLPIDYVPFYNPNEPEKSTQQAVRKLEEYINRYPKQHAAMFFELILGEGGYYEGSHLFHKALMEICKENSIAVLVDEVQTFARTQTLFAFQFYQLDKFIDIVWIGKASQVCATLFTEEFTPQPGLLSQTFTSSSTAITCAEAILDALLTENYLGPNGKIAHMSNLFIDALKTLSKELPTLISGPFGVGLMIAFTPFQGEPSKTTAFVKNLYENGILSFMAGASPMRVRFLIPIGAIQPEHIPNAITIIKKTLLQTQ